MDVGKVTTRVVSALFGVAIILISIWYGGNSGLLPVEGSEESRMIDSLFRTMLIIATAIFLFVQGLLVYSLFKFRQKPGDTTDGPPIHGSIPLEVLWTAIPTALVLYVSILSYDVSGKLAVGGSGGLGCSVDCPLVEQVANPTGKELIVDVIAQQYGWTFQYSGYSTEVGEMHIPAGREVIVNLKSKDVLHAFWVPAFRVKQDIIPGRITRLKFTATKTGEYPLRCAELCGAYHGIMNSVVYVDEPKAFEAWVNKELAVKTAQVARVPAPLALK
ncbi:cytochrome c oxidase subunit II [Candidatus Cyanaurora vandensis]|uniref:cytochrome c oxidase subunit II n=1 Tax=Candidatus Cyanaurora vandensis TaxID=2714958 RepID=UPI00257E7BDD|nr:cytochrome c oxidase subunit II [Candidatus Cyanaurora vandensis]